MNEKIIVPIPRKVGRLDTPSPKPFRNRKKYRRQPKHKGLTTDA